MVCVSTNFKKIYGENYFAKSNEEMLQNLDLSLPLSNWMLCEANKKKVPRRTLGTVKGLFLQFKKEMRQF